MKLEIHKMLVLKTSHVSPLTSARIAEGTERQASGGLTEDDFWLPQFTRDEGWMFYTRDTKQEETHGAPEDLLVVLRFALEQGCHWVMFDCDGPEVEGLPLFEW